VAWSGRESEEQPEEANDKDLIIDLKFNGGRFISVIDGIDTEKPGWELPTSFGEARNTVMIAGLGAKVRGARGGRVEQSDQATNYYGAAGDHCFGYTSVVDDPDWTYSKSNPKPRKHVVIDE
jgi:hypothetical protein